MSPEGFSPRVELSQELRVFARLGAVLPEHVHLVIARTPRNIRTVVGHLKSEATRSLRKQGQFLDRSPWADHGWNVLAVDLPGHCKSEGDAPASVEEAADFIAALIDAAGDSCRIACVPRSYCGRTAGVRIAARG